MTKEILKCSNCDLYTLKAVCSKCGEKTLSTKPAKFSPLDKQGKFRRIYKKKYKGL
ncbi:nucleolar RNA-binding Nop10p family protein [Candidatus Woesearchaeota archaeon]|nr:nucleolar RNA-binding Nop10p family protein [Candidatus Woesearchaeota archaeon]